MLVSLADVEARQLSRSRGLVVLDQVSKRFGSTLAVKAVSLTVRAGEVHAILGENGAGKSTIGKILSGLVQPDDGRMRIDGKYSQLPSISAAREQGFAMVFQELSLVPDLTVAENICFGTERATRPFSWLQKRAETARCRQLLAQYDFDFDLDQRVRTLSVANQQLVEVVKALARDPRLLILDEPTAMLGVREKEKLLNVIRAARQRGVAIVFVTHHVDEVVEVADRVSLMKDGVLVDSFDMSPEIDTAFIVAKLVGHTRTRVAHREGPAAGKAVFSFRGLPGKDDKRVDIGISAGQVVGIYGVVGSGCEAIGRAAIGLANLGRATMTLGGVPYRPRTPSQAARRGVSYLPSGRAVNCLLPNRSVRENLMISQLAKVQRFGVISRRQERGVAETTLRRFRTRFSDAGDLITTLSGGNQQKVFLARCLGRDSNLVVLEDPTAGVDIGSKQDIHELIHDKAAAGLAVFLISSDLLETIALCDVIYTVLGGRIMGFYENPTPDDEAAILADVLGR